MKNETSERDDVMFGLASDVCVIVEGYIGPYVGKEGGAYIIVFIKRV